MRHRTPRLGCAVVMVTSLLLAQAGQALATAPAGAPVILGPADGSSVGNSNPTLSWSGLTGAVRYKVQISTISSFSSTIYSQDTYALQVTPPAILPFATLYWRVAGEDGSGATGPYSVASFTKSVNTAPTPLTPTNGQTLVFPTDPAIFSWQPVPGAVSYVLQIDDASDFVGATQYLTANTSFTLTDTQAFTQSDGVTPQVWWWQVQAKFANASVTAWSSGWSYQISWPAAPQLESPANSATGVTDTVFSWDAVLGAAWYQIQVSPNGDFANNWVIDQSSIFGTRYAPANNLNNSAYFWRVRARADGAATNYGPWSSTFVFTRSWNTRPVIESPRWAGGVTQPPVISSLRFSWTPPSSSGAGWVDHASQYLVQFSTSSTFASGNQSCLTNQTTFSPYDGCNLSFNVGTVYYWRVRGNDQPVPVIGLWDSTSTADTQRFIYEPDLPDLSCGPHGAQLVATPVLCWSAISGAVQYQVSIDNAAGASVEQVTTYGLSFTPLVTLNAGDGPFTWNVVSIDAGGHSGLSRATGDWPSFNVTPPAPDPTFSLLAPTDSSHSIRMPSMTWVPYTGASYYKVLYGPTPDILSMTPLSGGTELPYAGFTYASVPLAAQRWYWVVQAFDSGDHLIGQSAQSSFYVGSHPDGSDWIIPWDQYVTPECTAQTDPQVLRCTPLLGQTQEMTWTPDPDAGFYVVTVSKDENFTNIYKTYRTFVNSLTPVESWLDGQAGDTYYWFVRPCADSNAAFCGPGPDTNAGLDNASSYKKQSPAPTGITTTTADNPPAVATTIPNQVTFNWPDYLSTSQASEYPVAGANSVRVTQEAQQYKITVSTTLDFSSILDSKTIDQTQYTPWQITYPEGPLYWRVQAIDGSGNLLTVSAAGTVIKSSPLIGLTSPGNAAAVSGEPYFTWAPQSWTAKYIIEVYKNGDLNFAPTNRILNITTAVSAYSPTTNIAAGVYAWRVQRLDQSGRAGPWSTGRTFTLQPAAPVLNTPLDQANVKGSNMDFTWLGVQGAASYRFQTSTVSSFSSTKESQDTVMTAWSPVSQYVAGTYFWRVSVLDASNNVLSTSSYRSFIVLTGSTYTAVTPTRLLDSRDGTGLAGHVPAAFQSHVARPFQVTGGVVPANATAVTGNLTVTQQTSNGFVYVGPLSMDNPTSSNLNFPVGDDRANAVTVLLGTGGQLFVTYAAPSTGQQAHVIFDVTGYFTPDAYGATYHPVTPTRLLDTRSALGLAGLFQSHVARTLQATGGIVPSTATAVTGNLTVTQQSSMGFLYVGPAPVNNPTSSNLNFPVGDDRANAVTVLLGTGGRLSITYAAPTAGQTTQVLFDVTGYFTPDLTGSTYTAVSPTRLLDSRDGTGYAGGAFKSHVAQPFQVTGDNAIPGGGILTIPAAATAVSGNLTVTQQSALGFLYIGPSSVNNPTSSSLNFPLADDRANAINVQLGSGGRLSVTYASPIVTATAHAIFDITGYFAPPS